MKHALRGRRVCPRRPHLCGQHRRRPLPMDPLTRSSAFPEPACKLTVKIYALAGAGLHRNHKKPA
ncbi:MAG: hypothetical protein A3F83_13070 [Candidatus Glassbacteria bacterium RIFCSPLOWO2_12_FULL_58_11]|uniref:Uncharacterized protein n=2 Tax=Candidatus Glassiibacteriota TaxID=1817805 RepID=A0A1F5Z2K6_9BACT|nr:MAG: hypothetical protein A2Z86_03565 [Candidatus Glassbacteria bacterium GWA2_58_10]OGG06544.1 MAG: hypothetical protein A3F83_13070 [Candidatus Glassbacteria bacterium RIFCSPLOWO2_12_FULL_58_11]